MVKKSISECNHKVAYRLAVSDVAKKSVIGDWDGNIVWGATLWGIAYAIMETLKVDGFKFEWDQTERPQPVPRKTNTVRYLRDLCVRKDGSAGYVDTGRKGNDYYIVGQIEGRWVRLVELTNVTDTCTV